MNKVGGGGGGGGGTAGISNSSNRSDDSELDNEGGEEDLSLDENSQLEGSEEEERNHWFDSMRTLLMYEDFAFQEIERRRTHLKNIPEKLSKMLPSISSDKFKLFEDAISYNQELLTSIVQLQVDINFSNQIGRRQDFPDKFDGPDIQYNQQHRNEAIISSIYREWSAEARPEREKAFRPLMDELQKHLPVTEGTRFKYRVCVPGCGTARLPIEIAARGYRTEANEFSSFMVMASHFMLNGIQQEKEFYICPWLSKSSNVDKVSDALAGFLVPDISAPDIFVDSANNADDEEREVLCQDCGTPPIDSPKFSFNSGNFVSIYSRQHQIGAWDAVVTCFFIDTAPVIMEYIDTIWNMLGEGGIWTNIGPLLYHWQNDEEGNGDERFKQSVELSYEEIREVLLKYGFTFLTETDIPDVTYSGCPRSLMNTVYMTKHFTVQKKTRR